MINPNNIIGKILAKSRMRMKIPSTDKFSRNNTEDADYNECAICSIKLISLTQRKIGICKRCEMDEKREMEAQIAMGSPENLW